MVDEWREKLVEAAAEANDELMNKYLEDGELSARTRSAPGLRARTLANEIVPVFCGSAFKNKGVQAVLDAVIHYMPSPTEVPAIRGILDDKNRTEAVRHSTDDEPFAALAFKIATDPFVGYADLLPRLLRCAEVRRHRSTTRSSSARSASGACCRCTPTPARRSRKFAPVTSPRRSA